VNHKPKLDSIFYVFGSSSSPRASLAQLNNADELPLLVYKQFQRLIPAYRRGQDIHYGMIEGYFIDSIFGDMADLMGRSEPLPPWAEQVLDGYDSLHFMSATAVRFYLTNKLEFPGEYLRMIARNDLPKNLGTSIFTPILEPRKRAA
jgi:hypothetical protein